MARSWAGSAIAIAAILLVTAFLPGQAQAGSTIGQARANTQGLGCPGGTYIQTKSASNSYAAPHDGVITSWTNLGFSEAMKFKVARIGSAGSFTVIGQDGPHPQANGVRTTNPIRIPVRQGDVIGYHTTGTYCFFGGSSDNEYTFSSGDVPAGGTGFFSEPPASGTVPVEAYLERDRDSDGYGDETQDACPTNASTQGVCPLPTTLGQTFTPSNSIPVTGTSIPALPADLRYSAPADGVITSWSYRASTLVNGTAKLKAMRPLGGDDFQVVAESEAKTPAASTLNTFPTRLPVRAGDRIGIGTNNLPALSPSVYDLGSSWFVSSDPDPGASATFTKSSRLINISALLEADDDGDGFGDTTQDLCPTDATTQGACRIVQPQPPTGDDACDRARKKLAKAKSKLKKLKQKDAAAKQIKKAKAKVKKAKSGVKKAC